MGADSWTEPSISSLGLKVHLARPSTDHIKDDLAQTGHMGRG